MAERFAAYLLTQGVDSIAELEGDAWGIWIRDENQVHRAKEELAKFRDAPDSPQYVEAQTKASRLLREDEERRKRAKKNVVNMNSRWRRMPNPGRPGSGFSMQSTPVTLVLIAASVIVTLLANFGNNPENAVYRGVMFMDPVHRDADITVRDFDQPQFRLTDIRQGQVWRVLSPIFLHLDILHLLFNVYWLFLLGSQIENRFGSLVLGALVLSMGLFSTVMQGMFPVEWGGWPWGGGMSGVVYGLLGYIWILSRFDPNSGLYLSQLTLILMLVWLFACLTGKVGPVANVAHFAGIGSGMSLAFLRILVSRK
ncbi:Rhomboid protease GlpG [Lignipirellula cremea]|uniref:Rhomboid protease GlpG n=2 Tax=Lignipirellula cremea TaxID=2528010 RepID=A0A518E287_9BACT|nr:Rhomboid protease GlpG [Lignipirellula cremea]